ncbi:MAG: DUF559 domain-containing protein, partial [Spirochaetales bacterium]|nr:DUF559 domain-containing protein [Spirochaetales bacterium]
WDNVSRYQTPFLTESKQKSFDIILGSLDDKIELNRKMNETLEAMAQALFKSWFVDFDPVIDNALEAGNEIPDELMERAAIRKGILERNGGQLITGSDTAARPSPPAPLPEKGEGRKIVEGVHYRGGFCYSGLVELARELRQRETDAEKFAWELLRNRKFLNLKFRRQHQIGLYIVDFYCNEVKLVLELDGGIHLEKEQKEKDVIRDEYLESEGFTVLRISNNVVLEKTEKFLKQIETIVSSLSTHSPPSLQSSSSPSGRGRVREWKKPNLPPKQPPPLPKRKQSETYSELQDTESQSLPDNIKRLFPSEFEYNDKMGWVPKGWTVGLLSDVLGVKYGKDHKKLADGNIPVYGSGGVMRYVDKSLYCGESILIPRKVTLTNIMHVNEEFWSVDTMFYTVIKMSNYGEYAFYYLKGLDFISMDVGSAVPSMTTKVLNGLKLILPKSEVIEEFDKLLSDYFDAKKEKNHENQSLAALRDTLLPKLLSGDLPIPSNLLKGFENE